MDKKKITTRSLAPVLLMGVAGSVPASAMALPRGTARTGVITRAEWEADLRAKGGASPDLCRERCGESWGAYTHAGTDAFNHGDYSEIETACEDIDESAPRGQAQWYCEGRGHYFGTWYKWHVWLSPYGYSLDGYFPN